MVGTHVFIDAHQIDQLRFAHKDAELFSQLLTSGQLAVSFSRRSIRSAVDKDYAETKAALKEAITSAVSGETVFIFISGQGLAFPTWEQGYIAASDTQAEKPESTAISVRELRQWIAASAADQVWLFADLCRQSAGRRDNRINYRLQKEFQELARFPFGAVLATSDRQPSEEKESLMSSLSKGHGVFGYLLVSGLYGRLPSVKTDADTDRDGRVTSTELFDFLLTRQKSITGVARKPGVYGRLPQTNASVVATPSGRGVSSLRMSTSPQLLAAVSPLIHRVLPMQIAAAIPGAIVPECPELDTQTVNDPVRAVRRLLNQRTTMSTEEWASRSGCLAVKLESAGQRVVALYGVGDQLPDDPAKLQPIDFATAAAAFEAAYLIRPEDHSLHVRQLFCSGRARAFEANTRGEARSLLGSARALQQRAGLPPMAEIENALGVTYFEAGEHSTATGYFERARQLSPSWVYPRHNLALASIELGNYSAAEREYREVIARAPHYPYLNYNLGLFLQRTNRRRAARSAYRDALGASERGVRLWNDVAGQWKRDGFDSYAEFALKKIAAYRKNQGEIHNAIGALDEAEAQASAAEREYRAAIQANPELVPALHNLAVLLWKRESGASAEAIELLRSVRRIDAAFHPSRMLLSSVMAKQGDLEGAVREIQDVLSTHPHLSNAHSELGDLLLRRGLYPQAEAAFSSAIDLQLKALRGRRNERDTNDRVAQAALYQRKADAVRLQDQRDRACELYLQAARVLKINADGVDRAALDREVRACRK